MRKLTLLVTPTQDDVLHGFARQCYDCPMAKAIERAIRPLSITYERKPVPFPKVKVTPGSVTVWSAKFLHFEERFNHDMILHCTMPPLISSWITEFDRAAEDHSFGRLHARPHWEKPAPDPFTLSLRVQHGTYITL